MTPKVLVVDRRAFASPNFSSRSVSSRIMENLSWLDAKTKISLQIRDEMDLSDVRPEGYDFIVFARHTSVESLMFSERAKKSGCKVVYEIDDFMPSLPKYIEYNKAEPDAKLERISHHLSIADTVTVPTDLAKNHIDGFYGVSAVVAPTGLTIERYLKKDFSEEGSGLLYTNTDLIKLTKFRDQFISLLSQFLVSADRQINVITDPNPQMDEIPNVVNLGNMDWFSHKEFLGSQQFLFAIVPLSGAEDEDELRFNECKSQIKFIDYGGMGIPAIYSRTPVYEKFVDNEVTGLIVENEARAWMDAMMRLNGDRGLRTKIKKNAYEHVLQHYHTSVTSQVWERIFGIR